MSYNRLKINPLKRHIPLYQSVMQRVVHLLVDGDFRPGQQLPSEWDLAAQWGVSQGTIRKGLNELVSRGILQRHQGVGTFVTQQNWDWGYYSFTEIPVLQQGRTERVWPVAEVLSLMLAAADEETAVQLGLKIAEPVWKIMLLWRTGYTEVAVDELFLPVALLPDLNVRFVRRRRSFYAFLLLEYDVLLDTAQQWLWQTALHPEIARLLKADMALPALCLGRLSQSVDGVLYEWRRRYLQLGNKSLQLSGAAAEF
ncbi:GntR family transcriptional regulator [Snodgrassella gandavensis]|uniref:GntR family transcriptional regulator n=1 Tax=Snodgrassella gandavensis TaxID=2946698 RepID=UPI0023B3289C|nr:GntR family transcriptional regulator [Snodgrassella gandavensis]